MIVCLCEGVSDRTIRQVIHSGKQDVRSIGRACGAGTRCGACVCDVKRLLDARGSTESVEGGDATSMLLRR